MKSFDITTLNNGIRVITKAIPNTPRTSINFFVDSGVKEANKAGIASIAWRLLLQGTTSRNAEQIANELDLNAIEMNIETKQDYTKIKSVALNEDFDKALELLTDIIKNPTFENFEKEVKKFKGELEVDLESPRIKAIDNLIKNMFENHPYGHTHTTALQLLPEITQSAVKEFYGSAISPEDVVISIAGNIDKNKIIKDLEACFGDMKAISRDKSPLDSGKIVANKTVTIVKEDAAQAQIIKGWLAPDITSEDQAKLSVLNVILGSSGLSSRLFLELRDKKGLAYHVRSNYDTLKYSGFFTVYIGTAPSNINTCLEGFDTEIKKLQEVLISDKELEDAKSNILGKRAFYHETNAQQSHYLGFYELMGLGADYDNKIVEKIKNVTPEDIKEVANKYLTKNSVLSILAPKEFLDKLN